MSQLWFHSVVFHSVVNVIRGWRIYLCHASSNCRRLTDICDILASDLSDYVLRGVLQRDHQVALKAVRATNLDCAGVSSNRPNEGTSQISESRVFPSRFEIHRLNLQLKENVRLTPRKCNEYLAPIETQSSRCLLHVSLFGSGFRISKTLFSLAQMYGGTNRRHTASGSLKMYQPHSSCLVLNYLHSVPNRALICIQATKLSSRPSLTSYVPNQ